jgi:hypothetical protein
MSMRRLPGIHKLALIFASMVMLPALLLGILGWLALSQERRRIDGRLGDELKVSANNLAQRLEAEIASWRQSLNSLRTGESELPEPWRRYAAEESGILVALVGDGRQIRATPAENVLYRLSSANGRPGFRPTEPWLAEAEAVELQTTNYDGAIARYRHLLSTAKPEHRVVVLHRLARSLRKAGLLAEALSALRLMEQEPDCLLESSCAGILVRGLH